MTLADTSATSGPTLEVVALGGLREFGMNLMASRLGETLSSSMPV